MRAVFNTVISLIVKVLLLFLLEKLQKKQKQPSEVTGVQESGKGVKRKTNDRDSSEDTKRQGAKQKTKSGRGKQWQNHNKIRFLIFLVS